MKDAGRVLQRHGALREQPLRVPLATECRPHLTGTMDGELAVQVLQPSFPSRRPRRAIALQVPAIT